MDVAETGTSHAEPAGSPSTGPAPTGSQLCVPGLQPRASQAADREQASGRQAQARCTLRTPGAGWGTPDGTEAGARERRVRHWEGLRDLRGEDVGGVRVDAGVRLLGVARGQRC